MVTGQRVTVMVAGQPVRGTSTGRVPVVPSPVPGCLVAPGATADVTHLVGETTRTQATLYAPKAAMLESTSIVIVPQDHPMCGKYAVTGDPARWSNGTVALMTRIE